MSYVSKWYLVLAINNIKNYAILNNKPLAKNISKVKKIDAKKDEQYSKKTKIIGYMAASAVVAAAVTAFIINRKMKSNISDIKRSCQTQLDNAREMYEGRISAVKSRLNDIQKEYKITDVDKLKEKNADLVAQNNELNIKVDELTQFRTHFNDLLGKNITNDTAYKRYITMARKQIMTGDLGYDVMAPADYSRHRSFFLFSDIMELPPRIPTKNRANIKPLKIPEVSADGHFDFIIPSSAEMKINKIKSIDFKPGHIETSMSAKYADSLQWDDDKIARDILQNFYDGHGQTLDGVRIISVPLENGKYKIRIEGKSTYAPNNAILLGESTKANNSKAAGNYGEGLKVSVLKLLREYGAEKVDLGSDNWEVSYKIVNSEVVSQPVLAYDLSKAKTNYDGNFLEFETDSKNLISTLRKSINRFYHSGNEHFKCPDFENDILGIKHMNSFGSGGVYIAGQRFEFNDSYDGLPGITVFIKSKPPKEVFNPSRDRLSINGDQLAKILNWSYDNMSKQEKLNFINVMEPFWELRARKHQTVFYKIFENFLEKAELYENPISIKFPDMYIADGNISQELASDLTKKGYKICHRRFEVLGMKSAEELIEEVRKHTAVTPTDAQIKKIKIIKETISILKEKLEKAGFNYDELENLKIHIFDSTTAKEKKLYDDINAEAIIDRISGSKPIVRGFWIDKTYLDNASFSDVIATALHEISHKAGGDETSDFSYKLTDVLQQYISAGNDSILSIKLSALEKLYNEVCANVVKA